MDKERELRAEIKQALNTPGTTVISAEYGHTVTISNSEGETPRAVPIPGRLQQPEEMSEPHLTDPSHYLPANPLHEAT